MKKQFTIILFIMFLNISSYSQSFYVEITAEGYEQPIIDKLLDLDKNITAKQEISDYTIKCVISNKGGYGKPAHGRIMILESKTGNTLLKSKDAEAMVNVFKGFQNPRFLLMEKIAKRELPELLSQLDKNIKKPSITKTKTDRLRELKLMFEEMLITQDEYDMEKKKILEEKE